MQRKIIHVDMDCFYAAVEMRDNPELHDKAIAVGGDPQRRGVLCTCNYLARSRGVRSAMATAYALRLCPDLIVLPVNMAKYREVALQIRAVFQEYTDLIEPLSLDEAYLDVSEATAHQGSATWIATAIREQIFQKCNLTASAGVAANKFLAKIASDWRKPNGQFVITPDAVTTFIEDLPVQKLFGVGKVTGQRLADLGIHTCAQLQAMPLATLIGQFGKFGVRLYNLSRGIDNNPVVSTRIRKSVSVEETFDHDLSDLQRCKEELIELYKRLQIRLARLDKSPQINKLFVKLKFSDFSITTIECTQEVLAIEQYQSLLQKAHQRRQLPIRLLGLGVRFADADVAEQLEFIEFS